MLDRKKVVIEQGLYKGGHGQEPISVEDMKLNSTSNNTSKTNKIEIWEVFKFLNVRK